SAIRSYLDLGFAAPLVRKIIQLDQSGVSDINKWNRYTLDLTTLIEKEPGAIYQVKLNFKKGYEAYYCDGQMTDVEIDESTALENWDTPSSGSSYWDGYEDYYYYDDYNWQERDNPCHSSYYYGSRHAVTKNILASDFGLLAKRGEKGELLVVATDLKSAQPLSGASIEIFDYQQQIIGQGVTDGEGLASIALEKKPFLLVVRQNRQKGYLKLDDGNSLSLS